MLRTEASVQGGTPTRDAAAAELFNAHYPRLTGWCRRLVDDDEAAHEIAAEAFTRLWSRWSRVDDPCGYLYVTATNLVRNHWRKRDRERRAMTRVFSAARTSDNTDTPADVDLRSLVQSLPERLRTPVLLHYYADYPIRDVATLLDRKEGSVKSDLHQARARLRLALEGTR